MFAWGPWLASVPAVQDYWDDLKGRPSKVFKFWDFNGRLQGLTEHYTLHHPAKQNIDVCVSILQTGTRTLLDVKSLAERDKNKKSGLPTPKARSLHHHTLFSRGTQFSAPEHQCVHACHEHAPMQTRHTHPLKPILSHGRKSSCN